MAEEKKSVFATLQALDLRDRHKEKNKLTYLPWANAWAEVKTIYPEATYDIIRSPEGNLYWTDGKTCRVETAVTIEGLTQHETLAVMDYKNASIPYESVTSVNVDKSIKRCLTKNLALFGLDLNLWVGEELSEEAKARNEKEEAEAQKAKAELDKHIKQVVDNGTKLIKQGLDKSEIVEIVASCNDGNGNPSSITSIEVCDEVIKLFKERAKNMKKEG